ncbi:MAG: hypothetical protein ACHQ49_00485 [Elusimicrobiota bacterium]
MRRFIAAATAASLMWGAGPSPVWAQVELARPVLPAAAVPGPMSAAAPAIAVALPAPLALASARSLSAPSLSLAAAPPAASDAPAPRVEALNRELAPALEAAGKLGESAAESAQGVGLNVMDALVAGKGSPVDNGPATAGEPSDLSSAKTYVVLHENGSQRMTLRDMLRWFRDPKPRIWSARVGTGLLGLTDCAVGNHGPKSERDVLLGVGDAGLAKLVELGFITCPSCRPEKLSVFWNAVKPSVEKIYGVDSLERFVDKTLIPFDARRLNWEEIVPLTGGFPSRLYVPKGLPASELVQLKRRLLLLSSNLPAVGYYDRDSPGRFHEYALP